MRYLIIKIHYPQSRFWRKELKEIILKHDPGVCISPSNVVLVLASTRDFSVNVRILLDVYDKNKLDLLDFMAPGAESFYVSDFLND
jgi:hypothetical protein